MGKMGTQIKKLEKKLQVDEQYTSALEECCGSAGFPIAAVKLAAIHSKIGDDVGLYSDSDDDDMIAALPSSIQDQLSLRETRKQTPRARSKLGVRDLSPEPASETYYPNRPEEQKPRSPIRTRSRSGTVLRKTVKVAVLKTMTNYH